MNGDSVVIRPPSEASSFLLPVTVGCSHNRCAFCGSYQGIAFRILGPEDIKGYIDRVAVAYGRSVRRVFLENGDALIAPQALLVDVLQHLRAQFPHLERVSTYASPRSVLKKSLEELRTLHNLGIQMAYLGVETGDEELLGKINKGVTRAQVIEAGQKLKSAGILTSVTVILGLAGVDGSEKHALETAKILSEIDPDYAGALTLMLVPGTPLYRDWQAGRFAPVSPFQALRELRLIIAGARLTDCFFTANHASNYLPLKARLPEQREALLQIIDDTLASKEMSRLRPETMRAL